MRKKLIILLLVEFLLLSTSSASDKESENTTFEAVKKSLWYQGVRPLTEEEVALSASRPVREIIYLSEELNLLEKEL